MIIEDYLKQMVFNLITRVLIRLVTKWLTRLIKKASKLISLSLVKRIGSIVIRVLLNLIYQKFDQS